MSETNHNEPWSVEDALVLDVNGSVLTESPWTYPGDELRRIVACVNALEGSPTDALERADVRHALEAFISALNSQLRGEMDDWEMSLVERRLSAIERLP